MLERFLLFSVVVLATRGRSEVPEHSLEHSAIASRLVGRVWIPSSGDQDMLPIWKKSQPVFCKNLEDLLRV